MRARAASETTPTTPDDGVTTSETHRVGAAIAASAEPATTSASKRACSGPTESAPEAPAVASTKPATTVASPKPATTVATAKPATAVATATPAAATVSTTTTVLSKGGGTCDQQDRK